MRTNTEIPVTGTRHAAPHRDGPDPGRVLWWTMVLVVAVALTTFHYAMTAPWKLAAPELMVDFQAAAPFQYRLLLPGLVNVLRAVFPLGVNLLLFLIEVAAWISLVVVAYRALEAFGVAATGLGPRFLALTVVVPVAAHLIPPDLRFESALVLEDGVLRLGAWHAERLFHYMYDLPAAVFTLALVLALRRLVQAPDSHRLAGYAALFSLATLNRETSIFMVPVFLAVCAPVLDRRTLAAAAALQLAVYAGIQLTLQWAFAANINPHASVPGTSYENHLLTNLALFANPLYLIVYCARLGAGLYLPVVALHRRLEPFLARTLGWFAVPFLVSTLFFGRLQEHRVLVELAPLLWLGALQALSRPASVAAHGEAPSTVPGAGGRAITKAGLGPAAGGPGTLDGAARTVAVRRHPRRGADAR